MKNYKEVQINDNDIIFQHDPDRPSPRKSMVGNEDIINISDNRSADSKEETDLDNSDFTRAELISKLVIKLQILTNMILKQPEKSYFPII